MVIYWLASLISMGITAIITKGPFGDSLIKKRLFFSAILCAFPLIALSGLRYGIGKDYSSYEFIYNIIGPTMSNEHQYEPVFTYLIVGLNRLGLSSQWFIAVTSILFLVLVFSSILEESPYSGLSIFLLISMQFYFQSTNIIRQMIACSICLYSIRYIKRRRFIPFLICVILAYGFHTSGVLFFPAFFLYGKRLKTRWYFGIIIVTFVVLNVLSGFLSSIIVRLSSKLNNGYYLTYFKTNAENRIGIVSFLINLLIFLWADYSIKPKEDQFSDFLLNMQFVAVLLSILNGSFPLIYRFRFYYAMPGIILIPKTINSKKLNYSSKIISGTLIVILFSLYIYYIEGYMNQSGAIPYMSVLNHT